MSLILVKRNKKGAKVMKKNIITILTVLSLLVTGCTVTNAGDNPGGSGSGEGGSGGSGENAFDLYETMSWKRASAINEGNRVIIATPNGAMSHFSNSQYVLKTFDPNSTTTNQEVAQFEIGKVNNKYTFKTYKGNYLSVANNSLTESDKPYEWTVEINDNAVISAENSHIYYRNRSGSFALSDVASNIYLYVADLPVYATAIEITGEKTVGVGSSITLSVVYTPSNTNIRSVTWASSDTSVATVSSDGVVSGLKIGKTTINATYKGDNQTLTASFEIEVAAIAVSKVSLNAENKSLNIGQSFTLNATILPSNASNKNVTWKSNNTGVATVDNGVVTAVSAGEATITVTTEDGGLTASCVVTVNAQSIDAWTVLIYMCGSDLESDNQLATSDITEMLSVRGQPDDVNIVIQTGGATKWSSKYSISARKIERWHVSNRSLVKDDSLSQANMADPKTLKSFVEWGLETYPAINTGLILWNHGGAMDGVCFDDNYATSQSVDALTADEVESAISGAFTTLNRNEKMNFIGYDACLMAVQDIAEINSSYFNYMISSQESESGYGWDYDTWVGDLYAKKDEEAIYQAIVDGFIADNRSESTLSVLNLDYADEYLEAWEAMSKKLEAIITSASSWNTFATLVNKCKKFGYYEDEEYDLSQYNGGYLYDIFDAYDFITRMLASSTYSSLSTELNTLKSAFSNLVIYNKYTRDYAGSYGLNLFCPLCGYNYKSYYSPSSKMTNFKTWASICYKYGSWYK